MKKALVYLLILLVALPPLLIGALRFVPPPVTSFMLQSDVWPIRYQWVPAARIAEVARKAVVAAEDQKFWTHDGFDMEAMAEAYLENQKRRKKRGASTITQQTAKNLFLWSGGGYVRKGIEAYFTVLIELFWPKKRILEVYLNIAEFGPGVYGVEAAARKFFGKSAASLAPTEAARLAAVLPNPKRWTVANPGPYVVSRSAWIMAQMGYRPPGRPAPVEEPLEPAEEPAVVEPPVATGTQPSVTETLTTPDAGEELPVEPTAPPTETNPAQPSSEPESTSLRPSPTPEYVPGEDMYEEVPEKDPSAAPLTTPMDTPAQY
ncbi:MAG: monofunctional biosynthetic peptidoglycan transglycosylase [Nevskiales bacterium]